MGYTRKEGEKTKTRRRRRRIALRAMRNNSKKMFCLARRPGEKRGMKARRAR